MKLEIEMDVKNRIDANFPFEVTFSDLSSENVCDLVKIFDEMDLHYGEEYNGYCVSKGVLGTFFYTCLSSFGIVARLMSRIQWGCNEGFLDWDGSEIEIQDAPQGSLIPDPEPDLVLMEDEKEVIFDSFPIMCDGVPIMTRNEYEYIRSI